MGMRLFVLCAVLISCISQADGQELTDKQLKDLMKVYYRDYAKDLTFRHKEKKSRLKMREKPAFTWTSADVGSFSSGDVFIWEQHGRPEVVACIGSSPSHLGAAFRNYFQEYHVLGDRTLQPAMLKTLGRWSPQGGVKLKPVTANRKPSSSARLRLGQMRQIAGSDFNCFMTYDGKQEEEPLRLMSQPFYRYDGEILAREGSEVIDGALFAFISSAGTDPELILLLECHREKNESRWMYAPIRFTHRKLRLDHRAKKVWSVEDWQSDPNDIYMVGSIEARRLADTKNVSRVPQIDAYSETAEKNPGVVRKRPVSIAVQCALVGSLCRTTI